MSKIFENSNMGVSKIAPFVSKYEVCLIGVYCIDVVCFILNKLLNVLVTEIEMII